MNQINTDQIENPLNIEEKDISLGIGIDDGDDDWDDNYEQYENELESGKRDMIHIKWIADGSTTLAETSKCLRDYADYLDELASNGYELEYPVDNSHGEVIRP